MPAPNGHGWYGDDVTATYSCADELSGVKSCAPGHSCQTKEIFPSNAVAVCVPG